MSLVAFSSPGPKLRARVSITIMAGGSFCGVILAMVSATSAADEGSVSAAGADDMKKGSVARLTS